MAGAPTETLATLSASALTIDANPQRRAIVIGNNSDTEMMVRIGDVATASIGLPLPPKQAFSLFNEYCPTDSISVYCSGASKKVTVYEWER